MKQIFFVLINNFLIKKSFIIVFGVYALDNIIIMTKIERKSKF